MWHSCWLHLSNKQIAMPDKAGDTRLQYTDCCNFQCNARYWRHLLSTVTVKFVCCCWYVAECIVWLTLPHKSSSLRTRPTKQPTGIYIVKSPRYFHQMASPLTGWWLRGSVNYPSVQKQWLNSGNLRRPTCSWHTFALPVWITAPRSKRISLPSAS